MKDRIGVIIMLEYGFQLAIFVPEQEAKQLLAAFHNNQLPPKLGGASTIPDGRAWNWTVESKKIVGMHTFYEVPFAQPQFGATPGGSGYQAAAPFGAGR